MKNLIFLFLFFSLFYWRCSKKYADNPVSPSKNGKILHKIDSENAPENVVFVDQFLSGMDLKLLLHHLTYSPRHLLIYFLIT